MILMIDNYDSFTYNLCQYVGVFRPDIKVFRNDEITIEEIRAMAPDHIILSPGPKSPAEAGICIDVVKNFYRELPILGVCLGHQSIGAAFGASIVHARQLMHGKQSVITHEDSVIFDGVPREFRACRYHSLAVDEDTLPPEIRVTARSEDGEIMAMEHVDYPLYGLQFHPESIYTEYGKRIIENFLNIQAKTPGRTGTVLDQIVDGKKKRLTVLKSQVSYEKMEEMAGKAEKSPASKTFYEALKAPGLSIIGEFKKASPSHGKMDDKVPLDERIADYNQSVDAISCLTEEDHFHGSTAYFKEIRNITTLPMIRKDFIVDPYQIYEARAMGADCILLIAAILDDERLRRFYSLATALKLDCLVEVHDEEEMKRALDINPRIIGVNNRNLKDFSIDLENTARLRDMVPENVAFVSESGVTEDSHIEFLKKYNVDALLIGSALMESPDPRALALHWKKVYDS